MSDKKNIVTISKSQYQETLNQLNDLIGDFKTKLAHEKKDLQNFQDKMGNDINFIEQTRRIQSSNAMFKDMAQAEIESIQNQIVLREKKVELEINSLEKSLFKLVQIKDTLSQVYPIALNSPRSSRSSANSEEEDLQSPKSPRKNSNGSSLGFSPMRFMKSKSFKY